MKIAGRLLQTGHAGSRWVRATGVGARLTDWTGRAAFTVAFVGWVHAVRQAD